MVTGKPFFVDSWRASWFYYQQIKRIEDAAPANAQMDMFADAQPLLPEEPTREQEYAEYLRSPAWKQRRYRAIERAGERCQGCGISKWSVTLEVHHMTYDRFKNEHPDDLIVLCPDCHKQADKKRQLQANLDNQKRLDDARFDRWACKVYGDEWRDITDTEQAHERYVAWCESKAEEAL